MSKPPAGWYPDPLMADTQRYWDGEQFTEQVAPMPKAAAAPAVATVACPYCREQIAEGSTRCRHCSGELRWCPRDQTMVALDVKKKWVGVARGGTQLQYRCRQCRKVLAGPRF